MLLTQEESAINRLTVEGFEDHREISLSPINAYRCRCNPRYETVDDWTNNHLGRCPDQLDLCDVFIY